jgi:hypothetical protein
MKQPSNNTAAAKLTAPQVRAMHFLGGAPGRFPNSHTLVALRERGLAVQTYPTGKWKLTEDGARKLEADGLTA